MTNYKSPGIQLALSPTSVEKGVIATFVELYCILLSTIFSIGRQQLSLFDANYALVITSSPFAVYLVHASIRNILGFETGLSKRVESHRCTISSSGALLLPIWFGLALTLRLSSKAFTDSELCSDSTFGDFLLDLLLLFAPLTGPVGGIWLASISLIAYFLLAVIGWWLFLVASLFNYHGWESLPRPREFLSPPLRILYRVW